MNRLQLGSSSYFSRPSNILDPHLFDGEHLKPYVRQTINRLLMDYLNSRYSGADSWAMVWLAGSAISYQWAASRGNGDLDVLFGIDYSKFVDANSEFEYMERNEITEAIDNDLKKNLWPFTSRFPFHISSTEDGLAQEYEITFFLNNNVEADPDSITNVHPYAAYNVTTDEWTIKPPRPETFTGTYPEQYEIKAGENKHQAKQLVDRYNYLRSQDSAQINTKSSLEFVIQEIRNMFDAIHLGRKNAFSQQGEGYGDFYNYQWQASKRDGIVTAFNEILNKEQ